MLLANNIFFKRTNKIIFEDLNISIPPKKIIHLTGNNGAGKTTLLKILSNIINPNDGDIFWNGKNINKNPYEFYKDLTFIMDRHTSNNSLTVYENLLFWRKLFSSKIKIKELDSVLDLLSLSLHKNTPIKNLSFGEIKKLELLRLIIEQKKLWLLDEPFMGLDQDSIEIINQTIINHIELNGMVIFTSHILPNMPNLETYHLQNNA